MPDIDSIYTSNWLTGDELAGTADVTLTIEGAELKKFDDGKTKVIVSFGETDKRLVVNKTNALMISEVCGSQNTDAWIGKEITLYGTRVEFGGALRNGVRVRPPERKTGKKASFVKAKQFDERNPPDDDIPF